jgi:hypothetical protein
MAAASSPSGPPNCSSSIAARAGLGSAMIDTEEAQGANKLHSASDLRAIHCPVLAVFASKDPLVIAADEAAQARLALADNPRGNVVVLDGLSHWFQEGAVTGGEGDCAARSQCRFAPPGEPGCRLVGARVCRGEPPEPVVRQ